jgi:DNA processing protein
MRPENLYWVWLSCRLGAANTDFIRLIMKYESPYEIYAAEERALAATDGISEKTVKALSDKRLDEASEIIGFCSGTGVRIMPYNDEKYPNRLRMLSDPPVLLYVKGNFPDMNNRVCIAVVGTRRMSEYGREYAYRIAYELGAANVCVVSGMALGIDGVAACGALTGGGTTVAVLGSGIDIIYPREHAKLMNLISENGAVVSEYPPGTPPAGEHFPIRNRIISGMCQGTLVIEADSKSGAMITARSADAQGRQIFAIPGNLGKENTEGTNRLIRDGGIVVIETEDILREYEYLYGKSIDTAKLYSARKKYSFNEEVFERMGVSARYAKLSAEKSNQPSAPADAFRKKDKEHKENINDSRTKIQDLTAENYIGKTRTVRKDIDSKEIKQEKKPAGDNSAEVLASLDEKYRKLFAEIPVDRAIPIDALARLGYSIGEIMSAMTILEVKGLVSSLPGGLYIRR